MLFRDDYLRRYVPIALIALVAFWAGHYLTHSNDRHADALPIEGFLWPNPPHLGQFSLQDDKGEEFDDSDLRGKWTLLFFGYTHCPDICPTTLATLKVVREKLRDLSVFNSHGQILFVSVDSERDTPAVLRSYVRYFDPTFRAATAPPEKLHLLTRQLGTTFVKISTGESPDYWFDHSSSMLLIGPDLRVLGEFVPPHNAQNLAARIRSIINFIDDDV